MNISLTATQYGTGHEGARLYVGFTHKYYILSYTYVMKGDGS